MDILLKYPTAIIITSGIAGLGLEAYGLPIFIVLIFALFILSGLDIVYGYYLAHRRKIVTSSILADGMMRKLFFQRLQKRHMRLNSGLLLYLQAVFILIHGYRDEYHK